MTDHGCLLASCRGEFVGIYNRLLRARLSFEAAFRLMFSLQETLALYRRFVFDRKLDRSRYKAELVGFGM